MRLDIPEMLIIFLVTVLVAVWVNHWKGMRRRRIMSPPEDSALALRNIAR
jgi:hypothetical protein